MFSAIFSLIFLIISSAFGIYVYVESGKEAASIFWGVYAFGAIFIPGIVVVFPGYEKRLDKNGLEIKVPRGRNLSKAQSLMILGWIVGVGLFLVFFT